MNLTHCCRVLRIILRSSSCQFLSRQNNTTIPECLHFRINFRDVIQRWKFTRRSEGINCGLHEFPTNSARNFFQRDKESRRRISGTLSPTPRETSDGFSSVCKSPRADLLIRARQPASRRSLKRPPLAPLARIQLPMLMPNL